MIPSVEDRLDACTRLWDLEIVRKFDRSYNHVYLATRAGDTVVLKLGGTGDYPLDREALVLGLWDGRGAVRLLAHDVANGALLLEHAAPGTTLTDLFLAGDDVRATGIAAGVMRELWRPVPAGLRPGLKSVAGYFEDFATFRCRLGGTGPLDPVRFAQAETLFAELLASSAEPVVLHGDLHHLNVLAARRAPWLAIDPKGVVGEPAYEAGALLRNPFPQLLAADSPARLLRRRVDQLAEALELDRERVRGWAVAQAVLAAVWSVEDDEDGEEYWMTCAELLAG